MKRREYIRQYSCNNKTVPDLEHPTIYRRGNTASHVPDNTSAHSHGQEINPQKVIALTVFILFFGICIWVSFGLPSLRSSVACEDSRLAVANCKLVVDYVKEVDVLMKALKKDSKYWDHNAIQAFENLKEIIAMVMEAQQDGTKTVKSVLAAIPNPKKSSVKPRVQLIQVQKKYSDPSGVSFLRRVVQFFCFG